MRKIFLLSYMVFLLCVVIFSYVFIDPNLIYLKPYVPGFLAASQQIKTTLYVVMIVIFFLFYWGWISLLKKNTLRNSDVIFGIYLTVIILFFSYSAMLSHDVFNYIATAKTLFFYHENPYVIMPIEFLQDPLLLFMHAANKTALYGPVWLLLTGVPYLAGLGHFILTFLLFKGMVVVFFLGTIFLLKKMTNDMMSIAFFVFNPLVVIETLIGNHNDIVMMFFVLLAYMLLRKKNLLLSSFSLLLSVLVKFATIFLIPVFLFVWWEGLQGKKMSENHPYYLGLLAMAIIFLLSPLREEIYPWYAVWLLVFLPFIYKNTLLRSLLIALSFGLLLRYVPYMFLLTHFGITPLVKVLVTFVPIAAVGLYLLAQKYIWSKNTTR